jgi:hypothetical protein
VNRLRLATLSDIHAGDQETTWTHVRSEPPAARRGEHPLNDLLTFIQTEQIRADYLVVPGDIANKADAVGLTYGWRKVRQIADLLSARLVAAPGNHDVITHTETGDPRRLLKMLLPSFPTGKATADADFWEHGWTMLEEDNHRILIVDSTIEFPPYPADTAEGSDEWKTYLSAIDRGTFSDNIERQIDQYLEHAEPKINIAIIHHHPQEHQLKDYMQDAYGPMHRGSELLHLLSRHPRVGRWVLIHGHKHIPLIANAVTATSNGPIILCSASAGAQIWPPVNTVTRNQFHILNASEASSGLVGTLRGTIESYTWGFGDGWNPSERTGSGLPAVTGFGCTKEYRDIAQDIAELMEGGPHQFMRYGDLIEQIPDLPYLLPLDMDFLESDLEHRGFGFSRSRQNKLVELYRSELT